MSRSTISTFQLFEMIPDAESARKYLEARLWKNGVTCPKCKGKESITARKDGFYRCNPCHTDFTVRTGTIFERSHVPLHKWIYAMYLLVTARKGISSLQLGKEIGITQKSAWFVLQRLREACGNDPTILKGIVEVDETFIGGKEANKHMHQRIRGDAETPRKTPIIGMREKNGRTKAFPAISVGKFALLNAVQMNVQKGSTIQTDEYRGYNDLPKLGYKHQTINHNLSQYSVNGVSTNGIESVWAVMRRGLHGVYHHASKKHLGRYVDEFTWRLNEGNVKRHSLERLDSFIGAISGKRLTYEDLIDDKDGLDSKPIAF
jgi:transposase-like protein